MQDQTTDPAPRNLYQRICAVLAEVGAIPKTGKFSGPGNYAFFESSEMMATLRPLLARHGLVLLPQVTGHTTRGPEGGKQITTTCTMTFTLVNADAPEERLVSTWVAEAADTGDKGINKAITAGMKYFLLKTFLISDREEPDADADGDDAGQGQGQQQQPTPRPATPPTTRPAAAAARPATPARPDAARVAWEAQVAAYGDLQAEYHRLTGESLPALPDGAVVETLARYVRAAQRKIAETKASQAAALPPAQTPERALATSI